VLTADRFTTSDEIVSIIGKPADNNDRKIQGTNRHEKK
jgi:hypothetical protein